MEFFGSLGQQCLSVGKYSAQVNEDLHAQGKRDVTNLSHAGTN
jgi:hypothetical protein